MPRPTPLRYCLDASISHKVAKALRTVEYDVVQASEVDELRLGTERHPGQAATDDLSVAQWSAEEGRILVAVDNDHTGRGHRSYALRDVGVEVIWFTSDLVGLHTQFQEIAKRLPHWQTTLSREPRAPRLWIQRGNRTAPELGDGKRRGRARQQS